MGFLVPAGVVAGEPYGGGVGERGTLFVFLKLLLENFVFVNILIML
jgi:hypothetical protein